MSEISVLNLPEIGEYDIKDATARNDIASKQDALTFDNTPTNGSNNPVKSGGIYSALSNKSNSEAIAPLFDTTETYSAGDLVMKDGNLYSFKNAHTGAWSASDVDETDVSEELDSKQDALDLDTHTLTGNPLSFTTDSSQVSSSTKITLEPIQKGSGDPSPSNVRTISGYDSVDVGIKNDRKNLIDISECVMGDLSSGTVYESQTPMPVTGYIEVKQNTTYMVYSTIPEVSSGEISLYNSNKSYIGRVFYSNGSLFTTPSNCNFIRKEFAIYNVESIASCGLMICEAGISIPLPTTIYGGTLDVESGELVVDKKMVTIGSLYWSKQSGNYGRFYTLVPDAKLDLTSCVVMSDIYKGYSDSTKPTNTNGTYISAYSNNTPAIKIWDDDYSSNDLSSWKSTYSSNKLVYDLATPITYHLTPHQVRLLQGANVVATNGTSIQLTYRDGKIAGLSDFGGLAKSIEGLGGLANAKQDKIEFSNHTFKWTPTTTDWVDLMGSSSFIELPANSWVDIVIMSDVSYPNNTPTTHISDIKVGFPSAPVAMYKFAVDTVNQYIHFSIPNYGSNSNHVKLYSKTPSTLINSEKAIVMYKKVIYI